MPSSFLSFLSATSASVPESFDTAIDAPEVSPSFALNVVFSIASILSFYTILAVLVDNTKNNQKATKTS